jgi:hypothetical protein
MRRYIESRLEDFRTELDNTTDSYHAEYLTGIIEAHEHLAEYAKENNAWVTADGDYGQGLFASFHPNDLTDDQWDNVVNLHENARYNYVVAILTGDTKMATQIEEEWFG